MTYPFLEPEDPDFDFDPELERKTERQADFDKRFALVPVDELVKGLSEQDAAAFHLELRRALEDYHLNREHRGSGLSKGARSELIAIDRQASALAKVLIDLSEEARSGLLSASQLFEHHEETGAIKLHDADIKQLIKILSGLINTAQITEAYLPTQRGRATDHALDKFILTLGAVYRDFYNQEPDKKPQIDAEGASSPFLAISMSTLKAFEPEKDLSEHALAKRLQRVMKAWRMQRSRNSPR